MRFSVVCVWLLVAWFSFVVLVEGQYAPPITSVRRGWRGRVEYIRADIRRQNLNTGTPTTPATRDYARRRGNPNDDAGHLIAQRLGGTGRETYNIIPQNRAVNRGAYRTRVEQPVYDAVNRGGTVIFEVWPRYRSARATRPYTLDYRATRPNGSVVLRRSTIANP